MDLTQAERRFQELQTQLRDGDLDERAFRVEVAKLLLQDDQGVFWMLDPDTGTWFRNQGEGWTPGDPGTEPLIQAGSQAEGKPGRRRRGRLWALAVALLLLLGLAGVLILLQAPIEVAWNPFRPTPIQDIQVQVTIASPADGSQVTLGQAVAVESTIDAAPSLRAVARVILQINGQTVDEQAVQPQTQPDQTSFPLSQPWRPEAAGEYEVEVTAFSDDNVPLGTAAITVQVTETPQEARPEPLCSPDAAFVGDVTIPPGSAFPPGVRMDKVWQVLNSGTCAWGIGYQLAPLEAEDRSTLGTVPVPPTAAGELADLAVTLWAPLEAGSHTGQWQLQAPDGEPFGPTLSLTILVEALAQESLPPVEPANLQAAITEDGQAVRLTWLDQSDNEDAFRVYRADVRDSIGLAPANTEVFVDEEVACGNRYRYLIVAFNAAGISAYSTAAEVVLPPCAPTDEPPVLNLTVVPTQVQVSEAFTITFEAGDDLGLNLVVVWGLETKEPALDSGRIFTCTDVTCAGSWPVTWTRQASTTLTLVAVALDSSGQESELARAGVAILPLLWRPEP